MMDALLERLLGGKRGRKEGEDDDDQLSDPLHPHEGALLLQQRPVYAFRLYRWEEVEPDAPGANATSFGRHLPKPRSGHKVVYYQGGLYSFGGYNPNVELSDPHLLDDPYWKGTRPLFKELWRFGVHSRSALLMELLLLLLLLLLLYC